MSTIKQMISTRLAFDIDYVLINIICKICMSMYVYINTENHLPCVTSHFSQHPLARPAALAGLWPAPGPEITEIPWMLMDVDGCCPSMVCDPEQF